MIYRNKRNNHRLSESSLTIVIKVGTTSICDEKTHFPVLSNLSSIVETVLKLKSLGHRVVLVTSAAVGTGLRRLNMEERPKTMAALQVCICNDMLSIAHRYHPGSGCCGTRAIDTTLRRSIWTISSTCRPDPFDEK